MDKEGGNVVHVQLCSCGHNTCILNMILSGHPLLADIPYLTMYRMCWSTAWGSTCTNLGSSDHNWPSLDSYDEIILDLHEIFQQY